MKTKSVIFMLLVTLILMGCGQEHKAKEVVDTFLDSNLVDKDYSIENFSKLDSTFYVTDTMIYRMRKNIADVGIYKHIKYVEREQPKKLFFIHVKFKVKGDSYEQTFYLDPQLQNVVSLKND